MFRFYSTLGLLGMWVVCGGTTHAQQITVYSSGSIALGNSRQLTAYVPFA
jgi:hypothetical protein